MSSLPQRRAARGLPAQGELTAALDIGASKVTCLIGRIDAAKSEGFSLIGGGRQQSRGFTGGAITDMQSLERSVRLAVEDAERQAGQRIGAVRLGITGPKVKSSLVSASLAPSGREVTVRDMRRVQAKALAGLDLREGQILAVYPVAYRIDDQDGVREPAGMVAEKMGVLLNVITAPTSLVRNLTECLTRAHLKVDRIVPSAIASGFGTLIEDERDNGAICIDMGSAVTAVSVFVHGAPAHLDLVSVGGGHVTADLAQGLGTTFAAAERMKTVYGQADFGAPGLAERIECPKLGNDGRLNAVRMPRAELTKIIAPRVEEVFELIHKRLIASRLRNVLPRRAVLTGGASQLPGVRDVAGRVLGMQTRLGRPVHAEILGESLATPGFSTVAGLLGYGLKGIPDVAWAGAAQGFPGVGGPGGRVNRTWAWLKENF
ncbi:MAG: cell division protein FtsA [Hyphomonadaceae bacterium]|nr:cell division protein FtsA [Hyphomonadaceae bacterium]